MYAIIRAYNRANLQGLMPISVKSSEDKSGKRFYVHKGGNFAQIFDIYEQFILVFSLGTNQEEAQYTAKRIPKRYHGNETWSGEIDTIREPFRSRAKDLAQIIGFKT
jgi:hypothetical protein